MATSPTSSGNRGSIIGFLTVSFEVHAYKKFGLWRPQIEDLEVDRLANARVRDLNDHLAEQLGPIYGPLPPLLLTATCLREFPDTDRSQRQQRSPPPSVQGRSTSSPPTSSPVGSMPLVCDEIWCYILRHYSTDHLSVCVHRKHDHLQNGRDSLLKECFPGFLTRELKHLDISRYLPARDLRSQLVKELCVEIFEHGTRVHHDLRRGVWLHLLGVFHPSLGSRDERERYMGKLRMVYDHLKGKLEGQNPDSFEQQQLVDAVYRDAIRTDTDHPYFANCRPVDGSYISQHYHQSESSTAEEDNIQKLINIIVIYTLEHDQVAYTQGMTDILSPILYVMKNEADAYIVFSAMVNRIKRNFEHWCSGTLLKLQRFRHLCAVLDPELYRSLTGNMEEDAFILFFGMVLIECRREFSFEDSFHLLETIWAGEACIKDSFPASTDVPLAQWAANYMTFNSQDVLQQVFDGSGGTYSAEPLRPTMSLSYSYPYQYSRNPSLISYSPTQPVHPFLVRPSEPEPTPSRAPSRVVVEVYSNSPPLRSPSANSSSTDTSVSSLDDNSNTSSPLQRERLQNVAEDDQLTLISQEQVDSRPRSQSDSNLHSISHSMSSQTRSPMVRRSLSPQPTPVDNLLLNQKLENSSFSHSESELYDSFSNSKVVPAMPPLQLPQQSQSGRSKKPTEMSDMSSVSSGTASAHNLVSSLKSSDDKKSGSISSDHPIPNGNPAATMNGQSSALPEAELQVSLKSNGWVHNGSCSSTPPCSPGSEVADSKIANHDELKYSAAATESNALPKKKVSITTVVSNHEQRAMSDTPLKPRDARSMGVPYHFSDNVNPVSDIRRLNVKPGGRGVGVVEHGGMITTIGHNLKNSLLPNHRSTERSPATTKSNSLLQSSGDPRQRQKTDGRDKRKKKVSSSPKRIQGSEVTSIDHSINPTPIQYDSDIPSSARVTPVAFFDTMNMLTRSTASSNRSSPFPPQLSQNNLRPGEGGSVTRQDGPTGEVIAEVEHDQDGDDDGRVGPSYHQAQHTRVRGSELEASIMSHLMSTEEGAPRVTREESLSVPFCECYSLFICLSILIQKRDVIIDDSADFYRLSEILNSQAGMQNLDRTLRGAHRLYKTYRDYQVAAFKWSNKSVDCWLDDTG